MLDVSKITVIGDREISVENYKGIIEYSVNCICILAKPKPIKILGSKLEICNMTKDILNIYGSFDSIKYDD